MVDLRLGYWLVAWLLLGCGQSSKAEDASGGGSGGSAGSSSGSAGSGSGGAAGSSGEAAAGSGSELASYFEPGLRLKPKVLALGDGIDVIEEPNDGGWYDSELDFDCYFAPDEAGMERCFPRALVAGGAMYADAACTRPVLAAGARSSCDGLRYQYVLMDRGGCAYHGLRLREELPPSTPLFVSPDGSSCQPSLATSELAPIYELEEVPAETFVGMHRGARERAPGLDAYVREGDDGSWQIIGHFDAAREAACFGLHPVLSPHSECLPSFASSLGFAESTCQTRVADVRQSSCDIEQPTAMLEARLDMNACPVGYDIELFEIDAIRETTRHEVDESGACVTSAIQPGELYVQGAPIDLMALPTLESLVVGSGAARALFSGFGGIPYLPIRHSGPSLVDDAGEACLPFDFPDGSVRCVPTTFAATGPAAFTYEDASCSGAPVVPWFPPPLCLTDVPLPRAVIFPDQTTKCLQRLTVSDVVAVVGKSNSSTFYAKDAATGACQAVEVSSPAPTYLRLGESLEPAEFPPLERTIRAANP